MFNDLLNNTPSGLLCFLFCGLCILFVSVLNALFRKRMKKYPEDYLGEAGGVMFGAISLVYSLILAFAIVAVWEDYEEINKSVIDEAVKLTDIRERSAKLPAPTAATIRKDLVDYARYEVDHEWHRLNHPRNNNPAIYRMRNFLLRIDSMSGTDDKVISAISDDVHDISELRNTRHSSSRSHIPSLVWVILIAGGFITLIFSWFFTRKPTWVNRIFAGMFICILSMCIFLLFMLDNPLCGKSAVSPAPLLHFIEETK